VPLISVENVTMKFGGLTAVDHVSLQIKPHDICGLIGPNGAGKTTLFNVIAGHYKPSGGMIRFQDRRIDGLHPYQINNLGVARTYQNINLFRSMTVLENIMVGRHPRLAAGVTGSIFRTRAQRTEERELRERCMDILHMVGLQDKAGETSRNLSYGEQRRLEICRGIASDPKLLLLDEPAAGMNTKEKLELVAFIRRIRDFGITVLVVEHDMKVVMGLTEYVFVLNFGKLIAEGKPSEIQTNPDVIKAYLGEDV
jgi:branched-chain amino acid transport system ATP-binding protein